jgi:hypothetical protein
MRRRRIGPSEWPRSPSRRQIFRWALWGAGILVCSTVQRRLGGGLYDANDILDYIQEEGRSLSSNHVDDDVIFDVQHWARPILPNDFAVNDRTGVNSAISNDAEEWTDSEEDNLDGSTDENYYDNDGYDYIEYDADDGGGDGIDDKDEISLEEELPPTIIPPEGIDWPFQTTNEARIYFIHVGKAGGQSLYKRIFVRLAKAYLPCRMAASEEALDTCYNPQRGADSTLRSRLYGHVHIFNPTFTEPEKEWLRRRTNLLLFTVRNPIDRIVSAFNYHHHELFQGEKPKPLKEYPREKKISARIYTQCFHSVEELAREVSGTNNSTRHPKCRGLGRALLQGMVQPVSHFYYNYGYYAHTVWYNRSKAVAVLRTESLWNDVARIEYLLGGNPEPFLAPEAQLKATHGSETYHLQSGLTAEGSIAICCTVHQELQVYHDLILYAVNLNASEKTDTLMVTLRHCGIHKTVPSKDVLEWKWKSWYRSYCPTILDDESPGDP